MEQTSLGFPPLTVTVFIVLAVSALAIDLIAHRKDKPISLKNASIWCLFWLSIGLGFGGFLYVQHGADIASLYLTGYALEEVLSVDNLFVIMAIFAWFKIPTGIATGCSTGALLVPLFSAVFLWRLGLVYWR